jgi:hypothetical protein
MFSVQPHSRHAGSHATVSKGSAQTQVPRLNFVMRCHVYSELLRSPYGWSILVVIYRGLVKDLKHRQRMAGDKHRAVLTSLVTRTESLTACSAALTFVGTNDVGSQ